MNRIHDGQKAMARDMDMRIMSEEDGRKRDVDSVRMELDRVARRLPDGTIATQDQVRLVSLISLNSLFTNYLRQYTVAKQNMSPSLFMYVHHVFQSEQIEEV